jgi:L-asparaginase
MADTIHFILTGGTIDSYYDGPSDTAKPNEKSKIPKYIQGLKLYSSVEFSEICMKDSRNITKSDLKKILEAVEHSKHKKIIITHGTYSMPDTGRFLKAHLKRNDQIIILTGSMIPLHGFLDTDAPFNIGFSMAMLQILNPGIYVCMNGKIFGHEEVAKDIKEGRFYSTFGSRDKIMKK